MAHVSGVTTRFVQDRTLSRIKATERPFRKRTFFTQRDRDKLNDKSSDF
jgi:hypothetical protein